MNEIDFSQLEKLQKQMESVDYTKACTRLGKGTSPKYKPKKNGKKWVEGKKYLNTVVPKVERDAPKILMQKMEEVLK